MNTKTEQQVWAEMTERLDRLTLEQLEKIAHDEQIAVGYDGPNMKATYVVAIVEERRRRCHKSNEDPAQHPWRKWHSIGFGGES